MWVFLNKFDTISYKTYIPLNQIDSPKSNQIYVSLEKKNSIEKSYSSFV